MGSFVDYLWDNGKGGWEREKEKVREKNGKMKNVHIEYITAVL